MHCTFEKQLTVFQKFKELGIEAKICIIPYYTNGVIMCYKNKESFTSFEDRIEIIRSIKYVDLAYVDTKDNKFEAWQKLKYNVLFVGDDWHNKPTWNETEEKLKEFDVKVVYFPYIQSTSSTKIINALSK